VKTRTLPAREVLAKLERILATKPSNTHKLIYGSARPLEEAVESLAEHRGYSWIGIYIAAGKQLVCQAYLGERPRNTKVKFGEGAVGAAATSGYMKMISHVAASKGHAKTDSAESGSQILLPIRIGARVLGVIDARVAGASGLHYRDKVLLQKTAILLARFLTSTGQALVRKLREDAGIKGFGRSTRTETSAAEQRGYKPASERATTATRKAAAGEMPRA